MKLSYAKMKSGFPLLTNLPIFDFSNQNQANDKTETFTFSKRVRITIRNGRKKISLDTTQRSGQCEHFYFPLKVTSANLFPTIPLAAFPPSSSAESQLTLSSATIPEDREISSSNWLKGEYCFSQIKNFFKSLVSRVCHDFDKELYWSDDSSVTSAKASTVPSPEDFPAWCKSNALRRHQP
ncbi:hypothetical protein AVEN_166292-1 [Araneus ventricosus]|uniref:Uncharacterized protein n=1 Tax=Araneus ventricosus TaxID=182803 RepID=A0A4Y2QRC8_ARAVE|nr:hypothetical protein AVEN_166292-1 [Araneus ventricosus]